MFEMAASSKRILVPLLFCTCKYTILHMYSDPVKTLGLKFLLFCSEVVLVS